MAWRLLAFLLLVSASLLSCLSCTPARMAVPPDVNASGASALQVSGRQSINIFDETFAFGSYQLLTVDRGWTRSTTWGFFGLENVNASQELSFVLQTPQGENWNCGCASNVDTRSLRLFLPEQQSEMRWELAGGRSYVCGFQAPDGKLWRLAMARSRSDGLLHGLLHGESFQLAVDASNRLSGTGFSLVGEASGYTFSLGAGRMAAVEVINEGRVWLPGDERLRNPVAAAAAALLLYQDIGQD